MTIIHARKERPLMGESQGFARVTVIVVAMLALGVRWITFRGEIKRHVDSFYSKRWRKGQTTVRSELSIT
ncbi:hypothetical protein JV59_24295 (plasmid) [Vibrio coralliilyticus]|nr:hypothetical protein JV59_24295 [Vibrio coralliilyticus]